VADLRPTLLAAAAKARILVFDHLHMLSTDERTENRDYEQALEVLQEVASTKRVHVIVIAHVRKAPPMGRGKPRLVSRIDDIHGSGHIAKLADNVVFVAQGAVTDGNEVLHLVVENKEGVSKLLVNQLQPTYFYIAKNRDDSSTTPRGPATPASASGTSSSRATWTSTPSAPP
jgi:hypothetical protein